MDFNFPYKNGLGVSKFLSHVSSECQDLIQKLLAYNPYFKDLIEQELKLSKMSSNNIK